MKEYLEKIPEEIKRLINKVRDIAARENVKAYLVGGFVRDLILGVRNLDLDIVIEGEGIKFAEAFADAVGAKITAHKLFGTATVFKKPALKIDFSSARKEFYPKPAHLPVVKSGSLKDDLYRRDFTINSMAIGLSNFRLVDYFGGGKDLRDKKIRLLHSQSFIDDPTRILRAIRFEQRYDFTIEPKTLSLLTEAVKMKMLELVHPHRMRDDLVLILKERKPIKGIMRIKKLTGFDFISPGLRIDVKSRLLLEAFEKEIGWFNKNYPGRRALDAWLIYLMGLLDSLGIKAIKKISALFGLRKGEEKRLISYKQAGCKFIAELSSPKIKPSRIFVLLERLSYETIIALRAKYMNRVFKRNIADFLEIYNGMRIFVSGEDLHGLGVLPGPRYQKIFARVLNAKLNGQVKTKEEELSLIRELLKNRS